MPTVTGLASSFITFSRPGATGGGATTTLSNGRIGWAGHNLLTNSESFDASSWTKTTTTVAANSHAAPNSTTTAETLTASSANGTTLQSYTALAVPYTFGVWLKRKTGTGNIQIAADSGTYTTVTITSDWALYTVTQTPAAGTISAGIRIVTSGDEVYAWGAHLYRSDLGGMQQNPAMGAGMGSYYPTTPPNALGYTEDFANAYWTKSSATIQSDATVASNGLTTADLIYPSSSGSYRSIYKTSVSGKTVSVYAKAAGKSHLAIVDASGGAFAAWFNLSTGVKGTVVAGYEHDMVPVGNGWYRCWLRPTSGSFSIVQVGVTDADNSTSVTANGTDGIYLWGAQLSDSASLDTYVPSYGAAVTSAAYYAPRLDFDPVTLAARGLLVEEQRVNGLTYSNDFGNGVWFKTRASISAGTYVSPDGVTTASLFKEDTSTSATHDLYISFSSTIGVTYTYSIFARQNPSAKRNLVFNLAANNFVQTKFNLETGTFTQGSGHTASIIPFGNGWFRCIVTVTATTTNGSLYLQLVDPVTDSVTYTGDGTSGVHVYGAQVESNASFATSYIPTGASTATRTADVASVSTQAFPYSASAGSLVINYNYIGGKSVPYIVGLDNGSGLTVFAGIRHDISQFSTDQGAVSISPALNVTGLNKVAFAQTTNDKAVSSNSNAANALSSTYTPGLATTLSIGLLGNNPGTYGITGHIRQITYIPRRLSNAELQSRSA